jgi:hypothetical protein
MGRSTLSPPTGNGEKDVGPFGDKLGLLLGREKQIPKVLFFGGERSEDATAYAKVRVPHVRALFCACEAEGQSPKVRRPHFAKLLTPHRASRIEGHPADSHAAGFGAN